MATLAAIFGTSLVLSFGLLALRASEIRAGRRFALANARCAADGWVSGWAHATGRQLRALEHRALDWLRALPHRAADVAAAILRLVATRALRMLRWIHERRAQGHAPREGSKGSVSFFVSALGESRPTASPAGFGARIESR